MSRTRSFSLCRVAICDIKATSEQKRPHVRKLVPLRHAIAKVEANLGRNLGRIRVVPQQNVDVMAVYRHRECQRVSKMRLVALALVLVSSPACADTFQDKWMGRIARPPADDQEASVYWEDKWDARGKRFKANEVSCAHRTEEFGTIFVVTNLDNGKKIECPVQDRGPLLAAGCSTSRSARRARSAATDCAASTCAVPATNKQVLAGCPALSFCFARSPRRRAGSRGCTTGRH